MSDWTLTTKQVREDFATRMDHHLDESRREAFDRWLEQVKAEAWQEGHDAGWEDRHADALIGWMASGPHESDAHNPYRQETEA